MFLGRSFSLHQLHAGYVSFKFLPSLTPLLLRTNATAPQAQRPGWLPENPHGLPAGPDGAPSRVLSKAKQAPEQSASFARRTSDLGTFKFTSSALVRTSKYPGEVADYPALRALRWIAAPFPNLNAIRTSSRLDMCLGRRSSLSTDPRTPQLRWTIAVFSGAQAQARGAAPTISGTD